MFAYITHDSSFYECWYTYKLNMLFNYTVFGKLISVILFTLSNKAITVIHFKMKWKYHYSKCNVSNS